MWLPLCISSHTYYCCKRHVLFNSYYFIDDEEDEPSYDTKDMSSQSAEIFIVKVFNVLSIHFLTVTKHLLPVGKALSVKCRSLGKYHLLIPLAKALVKVDHIAIECSDINYQNHKRSQVNVTTAIESLISNRAESPDVCS